MATNNYEDIYGKILMNVIYNFSLEIEDIDTNNECIVLSVNDYVQNFKIEVKNYSDIDKEEFYFVINGK